MEMIAKVSRSMYTMLESMAEREIDRDPINYIMEESFLKPSSEEKKDFEDLKIETYEQEGNERDLTLKKKKKGMYDPNLVDELEEVFQSAHENFVSTFRGPRLLTIKEEEKSPEVRTVLPFFKDPKVKISIWTIIKDSIGKDLSKMTVPVYFNSPISLL